MEKSDDVIQFKELCEKEDYKGAYELFKKDDSLVKKLHDSFEDKEIANALIIWTFNGFLSKRMGMEEEANQFYQAVKRYLPLQEELEGILETTQKNHIHFKS